VIVLADSSPLITLARARYFELLHEFYSEVVVSREVHDEITIAGAGLFHPELFSIALAAVDVAALNSGVD
jgi:predicted nucleic acid-binding protein